MRTCHWLHMCIPVFSLAPPAGGAGGVVLEKALSRHAVPHSKPAAIVVHTSVCCDIARQWFLPLPPKLVVYLGLWRSGNRAAGEYTISRPLELWRRRLHDDARWAPSA